MARKLIQNNRLKNFLIKYGIYESFLNNLIKSMSTSSMFSEFYAPTALKHINQNSKYVISRAFKWEDTPEGDDFWMDIEQAYIKEWNKSSKMGEKIDEIGL